jgi:hypothetical protein
LQQVSSFIREVQFPEKTQDDRIMELENVVRILDNRVQLLNETTHKGM